MSINKRDYVWQNYQLKSRTLKNVTQCFFDSRQQIDKLNLLKDVLHSNNIRYHIWDSALPATVYLNNNVLILKNIDLFIYYNPTISLWSNKEKTLQKLEEEDFFTLKDKTQYNIREFSLGMDAREAYKKNGKSIFQLTNNFLQNDTPLFKEKPFKTKDNSPVFNDYYTYSIPNYGINNKAISGLGRKNKETGSYRYQEECAYPFTSATNLKGFGLGTSFFYPVFSNVNWISTPLENSKGCMFTIECQSETGTIIISQTWKETLTRVITKFSVDKNKQKVILALRFPWKIQISNDNYAKFSFQESQQLCVLDYNLMVLASRENNENQFFELDLNQSYKIHFGNLSYSIDKASGSAPEIIDNPNDNIQDLILGDVGQKIKPDTILDVLYNLKDYHSFVFEKTKNEGPISLGWKDYISFKHQNKIRKVLNIETRFSSLKHIKNFYPTQEPVFLETKKDFSNATGSKEQLFIHSINFKQGPGNFVLFANSSRSNYFTQDNHSLIFRFTTPPANTNYGYGSSLEYKETVKYSDSITTQKVGIKNIDKNPNWYLLSNIGTQIEQPISAYFPEISVILENREQNIVAANLKQFKPIKTPVHKIEVDFIGASSKLIITNPSTNENNPLTVTRILVKGFNQETGKEDYQELITVPVTLNPGERRDYNIQLQEDLRYSVVVEYMDKLLGEKFVLDEAI